MGSNPILVGSLVGVRCKRAGREASRDPMALCTQKKGTVILDADNLPPSCATPHKIQLILSPVHFSYLHLAPLPTAALTFALDRVAWAFDPHVRCCGLVGQSACLVNRRS